MDIKVGNITYSSKLDSFISYSPDATTGKSKGKYLGTMGPFGFSVVSIVVNSEDGVTKLDKNYGKSLDAETIYTVLDNYLGAKNAQSFALAKYFVQKLMEIEDFFEKQTAFHLFGSSLLFIYDQENLDANSAQVRLIDFEHHFPADGKIDENYLFGLRNIRKLFEKFDDQEPAAKIWQSYDSGFFDLENWCKII